MKVLLDHMKAIIGCRQEKIGLTKDGKSLVAPIDPLVARQLLRQGHVGVTNPLMGAAAMSLAGKGGRGVASAPLLPLRVGWAQWLPSSRQPWQARRRGDQLQW